MKKGNYHERRSDQRIRGKPSPIGEIPMLELDVRLKTSNIQEVKEALNIYVQRTYQHIGSCIDLDKLRDRQQSTLARTLADLNPVAAPTTTSTSSLTTTRDPPTYTDEQKDIAKVMLIEDLKQHRKAEQEIAREISALFGAVYGTLSLASREKVIYSAEYVAIREQDNGFNLWKLTYKVHTAGGTNESEFRRKDRISKEYMQCRKEASETLAQFHARFRDCV
jgi:hypothetical protein